jgi:two-component system sensor histidine kinase YesM
MSVPEQAQITIKDRLRSLLLRDSLLPAVQLVCITLVVAVVVACGTSFLANRSAAAQVLSQIESTVSDYEVLLDQLAAEDGIIDPALSLTRRQQIIRQLYTVSGESVFSAQLYIWDAQGRLCLSTSQADEDSDSQYRRYSLLPELVLCTDTEIHILASHGSNRYLYLARAVQHRENTLGYLVLAIPERELTQYLSMLPQKCVVADSSFWIFSTNSYTFADAIGQLNHSLRNGVGLHSYQGRLYLEHFADAACGGLRVYTLADVTDQALVISTIFVTAVLVLLLLYWISLSTTEKMASAITQDIRTLNAAFAKVTAGDLDALADIHSSTEFESIGRHFMQMLDSLKRQIEQNKQLADTVAFQQVRQLRAQFKAHFLFNTLDNIRYICREDPELAENMVIMLSELLRYYVSNANEKVPLKNDLHSIRTYFEIIQVRFGEHFHYSIHLPEELEDALTLKMLLQPIVENSIKYGFARQADVRVTVEVSLRDGRLFCICRDNGPGVPEPLLRELTENLNHTDNSSGHLGLYNVHRRLQLTYGPAFGLTLTNQDGFCVTAVLPYEKEN